MADPVEVARTVQPRVTPCNVAEEKKNVCYWKLPAGGESA